MIPTGRLNYYKSGSKCFTCEILLLQHAHSHSLLWQNENFGLVLVLILKLWLKLHFDVSLSSFEVIISFTITRWIICELAITPVHDTRFLYPGCGRVFGLFVATRNVIYNCDIILLQTMKYECHTCMTVSPCCN